MSRHILDRLDFLERELATLRGAGRTPDRQPDGDLRIGRITAAATSVSVNAKTATGASDTSHNFSLSCYDVVLLDITGTAWTDTAAKTGEQWSSTTIRGAVTSGTHSVGDIVLLRQINGRWWIDSKGSSSSCLECRFAIVSSDSATMTALGLILATSYGCTACDLPETFLGCTVVEIHDPSGCFFNEPAEQLFDREGWARYMTPTNSLLYPYTVTPQWEVHALCCQLNSCVT